MKHGQVFSVAGLGLSAALLALVPSAPAYAQPPPGQPTIQISPEAEKEWERLYDEGRKAAKAGKWAQARDLFLRSWRIRRDFLVAINLGRAELELGKYRDAAEHLAYFTRN